MQIKSKTVLELVKEKRGHSFTIYFVWRFFFNICVLSQCIVYWIHFKNIHTFTYQKTLLHTLLFLKSSKALSVSLNMVLDRQIEKMLSLVFINRFSLSYSRLSWQAISKMLISFWLIWHATVKLDCVWESWFQQQLDIKWSIS